MSHLYATVSDRCVQTNYEVALQIAFSQVFQSDVGEGDWHHLDCGIVQTVGRVLQVSTTKQVTLDKRNISVSGD